jgi:peroxiredoxin Q/BCP
MTMVETGGVNMSVNIGQLAPEMELPSQEGNMVKLSDFRGKNIVLYFYPKDMTPGCTTEACDFRDHYQYFQDVNAVIIGVSPDPVKRHQTFSEKYGLPFILLADEEQKAANAYGVWKLKKNFGKEYMGIERSTFIINEEGYIVKEWRKVKVKGHVEEALQYLSELQR